MAHDLPLRDTSPSTTTPRHMQRRHFLAAAAATCATPSLSALAAGKPVRIIVPYAAGGAIDLSVRRMATVLEADLGVPLLNAAEDRVMICGSPEMVRDCHKALMERGFRLSRLAAPGHIAVENAW